MLESMTSTPEPDDRPAGTPDPAPIDDTVVAPTDQADAATAGPTESASEQGVPAAESGGEQRVPADGGASQASEPWASGSDADASQASRFDADASRASGSGAGGAADAFVPPWSGHRAPPPPPPGTSGFATRYGLVRPVHNRYIAGVCGAFARATNTDPVLWRVALPVLTVLGGFGILVYILGWLFIPAEGDSASPIESLIRRGRSSTSKWVTIVLGVIAALWIVATFSTGVGWKIVVAAAIVAALVVLGGSRRGNTSRWSSRPVDPQAGPGQSGFGPYSTYTQPTYAQPMYAQPTYGQPAADVPASASTASAAAMDAADASAANGGVATATGTGWPESAVWPAATLAAPSDPAMAPSDATLADDAGWQPPPYRPPFAPGGPYAQSDPYAPTADFTNPYNDPAYPLAFPGLTPGMPGPPNSPSSSPPNEPPAQRHRATVARRITLFATVLVVGVLGILDATNMTSVPAPAYFAAALATVGLGLVIGSVFGRVRGPIFLGILLTIGLAVTSLTSAYHGEEQTIRPTTFAQLPTTFDGSVGQVTVDLRKLNFTGQDRTIDLKLSAGQIVVELPPNVDAHVIAKVGVGDALLFGEHSNSGVRAHSNVTNDGADGPGGGRITINANIGFAGLVEVKR
jgi:phage shock protein PspC (stress-responsive transcriptional regulator)